MKLQVPSPADSPGGRIGNRVRGPDGTAAVSGEGTPTAKAGHWGDLRRRDGRERTVCSPARKSEDLLGDGVPEPPGQGRYGTAKGSAEKGRGSAEAAGAFLMFSLARRLARVLARCAGKGRCGI